MCKHELKDLMGVAGGIVCRKCGAKFDHIPKQEKAPAAKPEVKAEETEEKPKKATRKPAAKKGAK